MQLQGVGREKNIRDSSEYLNCVKNCLDIELPHLSMFYVNQKLFAKREMPKYEFSTTLLSRTCRKLGTGFLCKVA